MATLLRNSLAESLRVLLEAIDEVEGHSGDDHQCKVCRAMDVAHKALKKHDIDLRAAPLYVDGVPINKDWKPPSKQVHLDPAMENVVEVATDRLVRHRVGEDFLKTLPLEEQEAVLAPRRAEWRPSVAVIVTAVVGHFQTGVKQ